jgi:excisionase family DNA binding protein
VIDAGKVYTVPEAARELRIGVRTYYTRRKRGELPGVEVGRRVLVPGLQLVRFLEGAGSQADRP